MKIRLSFLFILLFSTLTVFAQPDSSGNLVDSTAGAPDSLNPADAVVELVEDIVDDPDDPILADEVEYVEKDWTFSLKSPFHTVLSHLHFLQKTHYYPDSAAMTLYSAGLKEEEVEKISKQLKEFYDGEGIYIMPDDLPSDPNYADSAGRHVYFPAPEYPDIYLYKRGDRWLYSSKTVKAIPRLHRSVYPFGTLDWIPDWAREPVPMLGIELWKLLGILVYFMVLLLLHRLLTAVIGKILDVIVKRISHRDLPAAPLRRVAKPLSWFILLYILSVFIPALQLPVWLNKYILLGIRILIPISAVMIFYNLVDLVAAWFEKQAEKTESTMDDQLIPLLRKMAKGMVIIVGLLFILSNLGVNITALLAGLSIGGLALALAAQDTVANFLGSVMIFIDQPFKVGDWIKTGDTEGIIEEVSVRSTRIRTFEGSLIYVPNAQLADAAVNNIAMRRYRRWKFSVGLTYDTPPSLVEAYVRGIRELAVSHPMMVSDMTEVHFTEMSASSLDILIVTFFNVNTFTDEMRGRHMFLIGLMKLAETLGVGFAFPTQTIHVENLPGQDSLSPTFETDESKVDKKMREFLDTFKEMHNKDHTPDTSD